MKDYEQLYYDSLYKINKLQQRINNLEQQIEIYKKMQPSKNVKSVIVNDLAVFINEKLDKKNFKSKLQEMIKGE